MKRTNIAGIAEIASGQWGMISSAQAGSVGVGAQALAQLTIGGHLERLTHGVYRLVGTPPGIHDDLRAAWIAIDPKLTAAQRIAAGPKDIVSHRSAAVIQDLGDIAGDALEFTSLMRRQSRRFDIRFHQGSFGKDDWHLADGLPVTTPLRTVADLANSRTDMGHLAGVARDAVMRHGVRGETLAEALVPYAKSLGAPSGDGAKAVELLLSLGGLPSSILDFFWPSANIVANVDYAAHGFDSNPSRK